MPMKYIASTSASFTAYHKTRGEKPHLHNYRVEIGVCANTLKDGMVENFLILKSMLIEVLKEIDGYYLNEIEYFDKENTTTEHIAEFIFERFKGKIKGDSKLIFVRVWETETEYVEVCED